jgi:hypothetical protein
METSHLTFLFFSACFGLKSGYKHHMLERAWSTLSAVFCANPCGDSQVFVAWSRMSACMSISRK